AVHLGRDLPGRRRRTAAEGTGDALHDGSHPSSLRSVDEVLRHPGTAVAVADNAQADPFERAAEQVLAVAVIRRFLGQHAVGEAVRGRDDGRLAGSRGAEADVLAGRGPSDALGAEPVSDAALA